MQLETPEDRLKIAGIDLPLPPKAVSNYAPWSKTGNLIYTSGQLPWISGELMFEGKLGSSLTDEQGYQACRLSALNAIAQLKDAVGDLNKVTQIVRVEGVLNVAINSGWSGQPKALDGASDVINEVFAERGLHTRMVYSNHEMPLDCASLIWLIAEVE